MELDDLNRTYLDYEAQTESKFKKLEEKFEDRPVGRV